MLNQITQANIQTMSFNIIIILVATCFLSGIEAAPLSLHDQLQVALQQIAELKGNGSFQSCCNISQIITDVYKTDRLESGIYNIPDVCGEQTNSFFKEIPKTQARCDFQNGGGWIVILRRNANVTRVSFNRPWADYERGFGDLNTEFWYGLRNIHCLTEREEVELQIEVRQDDGTGQVWTYGYFEVDGPETNYTLHIGQAQGPSGGQEAMAYHNGMQFTTNDRHNDLRSSNCANSYEGSGWWYKSCYYSLLTGSPSPRRTIWWSTYYPFAEMRLRPKSCKTIEICN